MIQETNSYQPASKILGLWYTEKGVDVDLTMTDMIYKAKIGLQRFNNVDISKYKRAPIAKAIVVSHFMCIERITIIDSKNKKLFKQHICNFIWNSKIEQIKRTHMFQPIENGGMGLIDLETLNISLRVQQITNQLKEEYTGNQILRYWLAKDTKYFTEDKEMNRYNIAAQKWYKKEIELGWKIFNKYPNGYYKIIRDYKKNQ